MRQISFVKEHYRQKQHGSLKQSNLKHRLVPFNFLEKIEKHSFFSRFFFTFLNFLKKFSWDQTNLKFVLGEKNVLLRMVVLSITGDVSLKKIIFLVLSGPIKVLFSIFWPKKIASIFFLFFILDISENELYTMRPSDVLSLYSLPNNRSIRKDFIIL